MTLTIIGLGLLFFIGHGLNWFFVKTKIPDLLILVLLGYTLGPIMGFLKPSDFGEVGSVLSTMALIVILYEGGLHQSAVELLKSSLPATLLSLSSFISIVIIAALIAFAIGFQSWPIAILLGVGVGSTSSAIVIPMVKALSIKPNTKTILSLESAFTDVLTIVIFLVLVEGVASGNFSAKEIFMGLGPKTIQALLVGFASGILWAFLKTKFETISKMAFANEAWALLTYGCIEAMGFNGALGVLTLGFMLSNLDILPGWMKRKMAKNSVTKEDLVLLSSITFILRTFFFIYLGTLIKFSNWKTVSIAVIISILIFLTRFLIVKFQFKGKDYSRLDAMVVTAMGPRGLACAVLATIPVQKGIEGGEWLQDVIFALIPMSILLTAIFVSLSESQKFRHKFGLLFKKFEEEVLPSDPLPKEVLAEGEMPTEVAAKDEKPTS